MKVLSESKVQQGACMTWAVMGAAGEPRIRQAVNKLLVVDAVFA